MTKRKRYDKEFKLYAVKLVEEKDRKIVETARELDVTEETLHNLVKEYRNEDDAGFVGSGNLKPEDKERRDLQNRLRDLEEENEILKQVMGIFTRNQK